MNEQVINIWTQFFIHKVRYLTIGGFAVNIYGYSRSTADIDIYIEDTNENRVNLRNALKDIGIGDFEEIEHIQFLPGWTDITLEYGLRLDIMTSVLGLEQLSFQELLDEATIVMFENIPVNFIDYQNLILAKKASNRLKDLLDIDELRKIYKDDEQ